MSEPAGVERDYALSRLTTVRAGGSADHFARPTSEDEVVALLAWAEGEGLPVGVVGSGSNLLVSDEGFRGLVMKLTEGLTRIEHRGTRVETGGGARLPSAAARAAGWGLTGLEFGVNIPGTVGGAVRMNANAYGGELGKVLDEVTVCTASGVQARRPEDLGLRYRGSELGEREVVSGASFALSEADPADVKATMGEMRRRRKEAQPSGIKTFGSTFVNPDDSRAEGRSAGQLLDAAGARGLTVGGARLSPKHANFVENTGRATTADILGVIAAARRKVYERFGVVLVPEVQILGEVSWPEEWQLNTED
jgi:UDP-N-acetylenolpyruvoylglucosamine reductase